MSAREIFAVRASKAVNSVFAKSTQIIALVGTSPPISPSAALQRTVFGEIVISIGVELRQVLPSVPAAPASVQAARALMNSRLIPPSSCRPERVLIIRVWSFMAYSRALRAHYHSQGLDLPSIARRDRCGCVHFQDKLEDVGQTWILRIIALDYENLLLALGGLFSRPDV
jgi:hypothetical protein